MVKKMRGVAVWSSGGLTSWPHRGTIQKCRQSPRQATTLLAPQNCFLRASGMTSSTFWQPIHYRGEILAGAGGIRKIRFAKGGRGKSSGVRAIYYYYGREAPIFLLEIFAKNEKSNLTAAEGNALAKVAAEIKHRLQGAKSSSKQASRVLCRA